VGDVCGFVFVVVSVVGGDSGSSGGGKRVHLVNHSTEILIPWPFQPPPPGTLVDCGVVEVGNLVVRANLTAQRQHDSCYLPPSNPKKLSQISSKSVAATPSPSRFSPNPSVLHLIVIMATLATGWSNRIQPSGHKMKAVPSPPPQQKVDFPF
jgi:hypothetical protein